MPRDTRLNGVTQSYREGCSLIDWIFAQQKLRHHFYMVSCLAMTTAAKSTAHFVRHAMHFWAQQIFRIFFNHCGYCTQSAYQQAAANMQ